MRRLGSLLAGGLLTFAATSCGEGRVRDAGSGGRLAPDHLELGVVYVGSEGSATVELRNTGPAKLHFSAEGEAPYFSVEPGSGHLGPYEMSTLTVVFAPEEEGLFEASWTLHFSGVRDPVSLVVVGEGRRSNVEAPDVLHFGAVRVGARERRELLLRNLVDEPLDVRIGASGGNVSSFQWNEGGVQLEPGASREIAVDFLPKGAAGMRELYLSLGCGGCPTRFVHLVGEAVVPLLEATPSSMEFGLVPAGATREAVTLVRNAGPVASGPLRVAWASGSHSPLQIVHPVDERELQPGEELEVVVSFHSPITEGERRGILEFISAEGPLPLTIPVRGQGGAPALRASVPSLDFVVPFGWDREAIVEVRNRGAPVRLDLRHTIQGLGAAAYEILPLDGTELKGSGGLRYRVRFDPPREGMHQALLEFTAAGAGPATVSLSGWGNVPIASCGETVRTAPNRPVSLQGEDDSRLGDGSCTWEMRSAPKGSSSVLLEQKACRAHFVPDLVGSYLVELEVADPAGNVDACVATVIAAPPSDLWVEAHWERISDVDLHLFNLDLGDPTQRGAWSSQANCYYANCQRGDGSLPWGMDASHWPTLERDDTIGTGPEQISIPRLMEGGRYTVGLHWFQGYREMETHATVNVFCLGEPVEEVEVFFDQSGLFYRLGDLTVTEEGCEFTRSLLRWEEF